MSNLSNKSKLTFFGVKRLTGGVGSLPAATNLNQQPERGREMNNQNSSIFRSLTQSRLAVSFIALGTVSGMASPAFATINNTVTVTGTPPVGPNITETADEEVSLEAATPSLLVTKSANTAGPVNDGDIITYTFTAENTGNQTLTAVSMADPHDAGASGSLSTISFAVASLTDVDSGGGTNANGVTTGDSTDNSLDSVWDTLAPGDTITWTATYTVTNADFVNAVGGDGTIDNTATGSATAPVGVADAITDDSDPVSIPVTAVVATLAVTKIATPDSGYGVGDTITYNYVVTNTGNVPMTNVGLVDDVTAGSGSDPVPTLETLNNTSGNSADDGLDEVVNTLAPGDTAEFEGTYVVTQSDVDTLQ
jgi:uncharacterized repeat protein (TIGR01451 family)